MIYPAPSDIPDEIQAKPAPRVPSSSYLLFQRWYLKLLKLWSAIHMSYRGGKYSVERLLVLGEYTQTHSLLHVVIVCVASFLPVEAFIVSQESVPLQDPALGWKANYGFWVRAALVIAAVLYTIVVQAKYLLIGFVISKRQLVVLLICVVTVQMIVAMTFAANIWFPIPFTVITLVPAFYVVSIGSTCAVLGMPVIREVLKHKQQLVRFGCFVASQQFMAVIYPAYQVLFHAANDTRYELPVVILLPVIKLIVKNIALRCVTHMEDMMPEAVIVTVDFFNALYMSTCMESATSTSTALLIVLIDIIQSATVLFRLHRRTRSIMPRLKETLGTSGVGNLLSGVCQLCKCEDSFQLQNRHRIRIRSSLLPTNSPEARELLARLESIRRTTNVKMHRRYSAPNKAIEQTRDAVFDTRHKISKMATWADRRKQSVQIHAALKKSASSTSIQKDDPTSVQHTGILREALEILFTVECLLLSAFLDAFVPFFYGIFMLVMVHLQSAKYHSELAGVTTETIGDVVDSIFIFSIVELVALGLLAALIYRNLGMNVVHHLAFVLETQTELIQSKLLGWVTMTLAFRVVHFGVDFTFKFAWLANSNK